LSVTTGMPGPLLRATDCEIDEPHQRVSIETAPAPAASRAMIRIMRRCAYRKSNPEIFVMQSAKDRAAKNTPCPLYSAR
jgi:hypothetical protein